MKKKSNSKGFTLIEMLVVISIIGLLSSVVLVAVSKGQSKANDSLRIQNAYAIQGAFLSAMADGIDLWIPNTSEEVACLGVTTDTVPNCSGAWPENGPSGAIDPETNAIISSRLAGGVIPRDPKFKNGIGTAFLYKTYISIAGVDGARMGNYLMWTVEGTSCGRGSSTPIIEPNGMVCWLRIGDSFIGQL